MGTPEIKLTKCVKYAGDVYKELVEKAGFPIDLAADFLNNIPDADAVPVVRCGDCKHAIVNESHSEKPLICCLTKMCGTTKKDWFCADGKRKMDGGTDNV